MMLPPTSMIPPTSRCTGGCQATMPKSNDSMLFCAPRVALIKMVADANGPGFTRLRPAAHAHIAAHVDQHIGNMRQQALDNPVCRPAFGDAAQVQPRAWRQA